MVNATATQTELIVLIEQSKKRLEEKRRSLREHSVHHDENDGVNADSSESSQSHFYEKAIRTSYDTLKKRDLNSYSSTPLYFSWERGHKHEDRTHRKYNAVDRKGELHTGGAHGSINSAGIPSHRSPKSFSEVQMSGKKSADCDRSVASMVYPMWQKSSRNIDGDYSSRKEKKKKSVADTGGKGLHKKSTMWSVDGKYSSDENLDSKNIIKRRDNAIDEIRKLQARLDAKLHVLEKRTFGNRHQHEQNNYEFEWKRSNPITHSAEKSGKVPNSNDSEYRNVVSVAGNEKHTHSPDQDYSQEKFKDIEKVDEMRESNGLIERIMLEQGIGSETQDCKFQPTKLTKSADFNETHPTHLENRQSRASRADNSVTEDHRISDAGIDSDLPASKVSGPTHDIQANTASITNENLYEDASESKEAGDTHQSTECKQSKPIKTSKCTTSSYQGKKGTKEDGRSRKATKARASVSLPVQSDSETPASTHKLYGHKTSHVGEIGTISDDEVEAAQSISESDMDESESQSARQVESDQKSTKFSELRSANVENVTGKRDIGHRSRGETKTNNTETRKAGKKVAEKYHTEKKKINATAHRKEADVLEQSHSKQKKNNGKRIQPVVAETQRADDDCMSSDSDNEESESDIEVSQKNSDVKKRLIHDADSRKCDKRKVSQSQNSQSMQVRPVQFDHEHSGIPANLKTKTHEKRTCKNVTESTSEKETDPTEIDSSNSSCGSLQSGESESEITSSDMSEGVAVENVDTKRCQKTKRSHVRKSSFSFPNENNIKAKRSSSSESDFTKESSSDACDKSPICWPRGMKKMYREKLANMNSKTHSFAPPRIKLFRQHSQLEQYWLWLHWYSAWQLWYIQKESNKAERKKKKHSREHAERVRSGDRRVCHEM